MGIVEEAESCSARRRKLRTGKQKTKNQRSFSSIAAAEREKPETAANNSLVLSKVNKWELCQNDAKATEVQRPSSYYFTINILLSIVPQLVFTLTLSLFLLVAALVTTDYRHQVLHWGCSQIWPSQWQTEARRLVTEEAPARLAALKLLVIPAALDLHQSFIAGDKGQ